MNPKIKNMALLQKKAKERRQQGLFVIEGRKMLEEILRDAPDALAELYVTQDYISFPEHRAALADVRYEIVTENVMKSMAETIEPQGVLAAVRMPRYDKTQLLKRENAVWLALEDLRDPGNLGTILRTSEAAGVAGVILSRNSVDIYNPKVIRSTMGAVFRVPHFYAEDFLSELEDLKKGGACLYAAHLEGTKAYDELSYAGKTVLLIGNEANGLSREAAEKADCLVKIPMEGKTESLNAAVAAALLMYEAYRRRR